MPKVRECFVHVTRDKLGNRVATPGERWVERSDIVTAEEQAASEQLAQATAQTEASNQHTIEDVTRTFNAQHRAYLALAAPTAAQRLAWERLTARNMIALNRLLLRDFSGTD